MGEKIKQINKIVLNIISDEDVDSGRCITYSLEQTNDSFIDNKLMDRDDKNKLKTNSIRSHFIPYNKDAEQIIKNSVRNEINQLLEKKKILEFNKNRVKLSGSMEVSI